MGVDWITALKWGIKDFVLGSGMKSIVAHVRLNNLEGTIRKKNALNVSDDS